MTITESRTGNVLLLTAAGRVDSTTASSLEQALLRAIDAGERRLAVDFTHVDYISSAGLRALLVAARKMKDARGAWALCALTEPVRQVFELAGFLPLFTIVPTSQAAVDRLVAGV
jgi:anti-sigma B factor antagonist